MLYIPVSEVKPACLQPTYQGMSMRIIFWDLFWALNCVSGLIVSGRCIFATTNNPLSKNIELINNCWCAHLQIKQTVPPCGRLSYVPVPSTRNHQYKPSTTSTLTFPSLIMGVCGSPLTVFRLFQVSVKSNVSGSWGSRSHFRSAPMRF